MTTLEVRAYRGPMNEVKRQELITSLQRYAIMLVICMLASLAITEFFSWAASAGARNQTITRRTY